MSRPMEPTKRMSDRPGYQYSIMVLLAAAMWGAGTSGFVLQYWMRGNLTKPMDVTDGAILLVSVLSVLLVVMLYILRSVVVRALSQALTIASVSTQSVQEPADSSDESGLR